MKLNKPSPICVYLVMTTTADETKLTFINNSPYGIIDVFEFNPKETLVRIRQLEQDNEQFKKYMKIHKETCCVDKTRENDNDLRFCNLI